MEKYLQLRDVAVIVDESAKLKNPDAKLTKTFFKLAPLFKRRIIMTGTPIPNRPQDIWSQIFFLDQGESLGPDYREFCEMVNLDNKLSRDQEKQNEFECSLVEIFPKIEQRSCKCTERLTGFNSIT